MNPQGTKVLTPYNRDALLFQADILATSEYLATIETQILDPTKRLMLAVLRCGILDFQKYLFSRGVEEKVLHSRGEFWIMEENDWLFSFRNICEALGLDAEYVRSGLLRWKAKYIADARSVGTLNGQDQRYGSRERRMSRRYVIFSLQATRR
jgi:hypothetical protein